MDRPCCDDAPPQPALRDRSRGSPCAARHRRSIWHLVLLSTTPAAAHRPSAGGLVRESVRHAARLARRADGSWLFRSRDRGEMGRLACCFPLSTFWPGSWLLSRAPGRTRSASTGCTRLTRDSGARSSLPATSAVTARTVAPAGLATRLAVLCVSPGPSCRNACSEWTPSRVRGAQRPGCSESHGSRTATVARTYSAWLPRLIPQLLRQGVRRRR